ncbi:hypothetical protein [Vibrio phage BONAISHI]|nr:hypothetical protein [Vibrio phage BONAISHI]
MELRTEDVIDGIKLALSPKDKNSLNVNFKIDYYLNDKEHGVITHFRQMFYDAHEVVRHVAKEKAELYDISFKLKSLERLYIKHHVKGSLDDALEDDIRILYIKSSFKLKRHTVEKALAAGTAANYIASVAHTGKTTMHFQILPKLDELIFKPLAPFLPSLDPKCPVTILDKAGKDVYIIRMNYKE